MKEALSRFTIVSFSGKLMECEGTFTLASKSPKIVILVNSVYTSGSQKVSGGHERQGRTQRSIEVPLDMFLLYYVSITPAELIGFTFTLVYVLTSTRSTSLRVFSIQLRQYSGCWSWTLELDTGAGRS